MFTIIYTFIHFKSNENVIVWLYKEIYNRIYCIYIIKDKLTFYIVTSHQRIFQTNEKKFLYLKKKTQFDRFVSRDL